MKSGTDTGYFRSEKFLDDPDAVGEDFWDSLGKKIPLGRAGLPEDVGRAVALPSSDKASYITGITLFNAFCVDEWR